MSTLNEQACQQSYSAEIQEYAEALSIIYDTHLWSLYSEDTQQTCRPHQKYVPYELG